jgi:hypothetical protein
MCRLLEQAKLVLEAVARKNSTFGVSISGTCVVQECFNALSNTVRGNHN